MQASIAQAHRLWAQPRFANLPAAVGFLVATVWMTWPLAPQAGSAVQDLGDPIFEIWVMRWVQHALVTAPLELYDANAFYPFRYSLAFSEEAISTALLAWPIYLVTGNDILAYNVLFLSSFWLMGFAVYLLARELGAWPGAAFVAGMIAAFAPARYGHVSHLHLLVFGWLPLAMWALLRYWRSGQFRYALIAGICLAMQLLASLHLAVYTTIALALFLPLLLWRERPHGADARRRHVSLGAAIVLPYLLFVPTLIPHLRAVELYGFERTRVEVSALAARLADFRSVFVTNQLLGRWLRTTTEPFFPGFVALTGLLALAAVGRWRWPITFTAGLSLLGAVLALGFEMELGGWAVPLPYAALYDLLPPLRGMRGVARFGLLTTIGIPLLTAFGLTAAWARLRPRLRHAPAVGTALTLLLALAVCIELRSEVGVKRVPNAAEEMTVYAWLAEQPPGPVAEFPANGALHDPLEPIWYLYGSTRHWQPLLNGYSGYLPPGHVDLLRHFAARDGHPSMVTADNVGLLQDVGIEYVVIHRRTGYDWQTALGAANQLPELTLMADVGESAVYRLNRADQPTIQLSLLRTESTAVAGDLLSLALQLRNPRATPVVVNLEGKLRVEVIRVSQMDGDEWRETMKLQVPNIIGPGVVTFPLRLDAPDDPGDYRYTLRVPELGTVELTQHVRVQLLAALSRPQVAVELVTEDWAGHCPAGDALMVVVWTALQSLGGNYSASIQLITGQNTIVRQVDAPLVSAQGTTNDWSVGERQRTELCLPTGGLPPGDYELLVAMYSTELGLPRIPLLLPDGTVSQEYRQHTTPLEVP